MMWSLPMLFFVYSKSEYTSIIGLCVRPAGRLHDNSSQLHSIELKLCAHNCLINISVEFEDENDLLRNGWVIEKIAIFGQTIPEGGYRVFFEKSFFSRNYLKHIWIDSVFNADSESDIGLESNRSFLMKQCLKKVSKCAKAVF